jgi:hypothetical protein
LSAAKAAGWFASPDSAIAAVAAAAAAHVNRRMFVSSIERPKRDRRHPARILRTKTVSPTPAT